MADIETPGHVLEIAGIKLEPLAVHHRDGMRRAANHTEIWRYMPVPARGEMFDPWFDWSLALSEQNKEIVFTAINSQTGEPVGSTRFLNIERRHKRAEIGHTFYSPDQWGTRLNPACKFLMLELAFEIWRLNRVELRCDARNVRSRAAISKLGAVEEGVLRKHMIVQDGVIRDSVQFAILDDEWPERKANLLDRLGVKNGTR